TPRPPPLSTLFPYTTLFRSIPMNKHVWVGLTHIYGVGRSRARIACVAAGVDPSTKVKDLTEAEVNSIRSQIAKYAVEGDLRRERSEEHTSELRSPDHLVCRL